MLVLDSFNKNSQSRTTHSGETFDQNTSREGDNQGLQGEVALHIASPIGLMRDDDE